MFTVMVYHIKLMFNHKKQYNYKLLKVFNQIINLVHRLYFNLINQAGYNVCMIESFK